MVRVFDLVAMTSLAFANTTQKACVQEASLHSTGIIDPRCGVHVTDKTCPITYALSAQLLSSLERPGFVPETPVPGTVTYRLRWSGPTPVAATGCNQTLPGCIELRHTRPGNPQTGCRWKFAPVRFSHPRASRRAKGGVLVANQVVFQVTWLNRFPNYEWCVFCQPEIKRKLIPALFNNQPLGIVSMN